MNHPFLLHKNISQSGRALAYSYVIIYYTMDDISLEFYSNCMYKIKGLIQPVSVNKKNELFFESQ